MKFDKEILEEELSKYKFKNCSNEDQVIIFSWLLKYNEIKHVIKYGSLEYQDKRIQYHYWIELFNGLIVDFDLSGLYPEKSLSGVFNIDDIEGLLYVGVIYREFLINKIIFNSLIDFNSGV